MERLLIGIILKPRGLKGVVKVKSTTDFAALRYKKGNEMILVKNGEEKIVKVASYLSEKGFDYVSFQELADINQIEPWLGSEIHMDRAKAKLPKDNYFHHDLIGCVVMDETMNEIGTVKAVESFTVQKTLRITRQDQPNKTLLLPFCPPFILKVDIEAKKIYVHLIEGMLAL